jgi:flavin-dependent dehydrogenase
MRNILVVGGGPAGAAAAISGRLDGASVRLVERSTAIRHKVCGEFLSPDTAELLEKLQLWPDFTALGPSKIRRCVLHLGHRAKAWSLPEPGWGLSRLQLDRMLIEKARALGATVSLGERVDYRAADGTGDCTILACGRTQAPAHQDRLFGFKTHFDGPSNDAVELFFGPSGYVGVSAVEHGITNVCGLAPESVMKRYGFDFDEMVLRPPALAERLRPLRRRMDWLVTGPLTFSRALPVAAAANTYPAGDSLSFVDPFTGSGILNALLTGRLAGVAAARQVSVPDYGKACRALLGRPFFVSSLLRHALQYAEAFQWLAGCIPGRVLFRLTRAHAGGTSGRNSAIPGFS